MKLAAHATPKYINYGDHPIETALKISQELVGNSVQPNGNVNQNGSGNENKVVTVACKADWWYFYNNDRFWYI